MKSMKKSTITIAIAACLAFAACGGDDGGGPTVDPIGTWTTVVTYGAGNCGATGTQTETFTVTRAVEGYQINSADQGQSFTGTVACTPDGCKLSGAWRGTFMKDEGLAPGSASINVSLDKANKISGSGMLGLDTGEAACSQSFMFAGTKS